MIIPNDENLDNIISETRIRYGRAYEPWSEKEDKLLVELHHSIESANILADILKRQPTAILSRILKLKQHTLK